MGMGVGLYEILPFWIGPGAPDGAKTSFVQTNLVAPEGAGKFRFANWITPGEPVPPPPAPGRSGPTDTPGPLASLLNSPPPGPQTGAIPGPPAPGRSTPAFAPFTPRGSSFDPCSVTLDTEQVANSTNLASQLVAAVRQVVSDLQGQPPASLLAPLENGVETVLGNSNPSPAMARSGLAEARRRLTADNLYCAGQARGATLRTCDAVRQALDVAVAAADAAQRVCTSAIGDDTPGGFDPPPGSGGSGGGGGVTHPRVANIP